MAVRMSAADYTRVERLVTSIVPSLQSLDAKIHWIGASRDLYDEAHGSDHRGVRGFAAIVS